MGLYGKVRIIEAPHVLKYAEMINIETHPSFCWIVIIDRGFMKYMYNIYKQQFEQNVFRTLS